MEGADDDLPARVRRLEDLHAIGQLRAHYCQSLDDGRWDDLVDLFTPDGAFVGLSTARGHDELRTFFADLQDVLTRGYGTQHFDGRSTRALRVLLHDNGVRTVGQHPAGEGHRSLTRT